MNRITTTSLVTIAALMAAAGEVHAQVDATRNPTAQRKLVLPAPGPAPEFDPTEVVNYFGKLYQAAIDEKTGLPKGYKEAVYMLSPGPIDKTDLRSISIVPIGITRNLGDSIFPPCYNPANGTYSVDGNVYAIYIKSPDYPGPGGVTYAGKVDEYYYSCSDKQFAKRLVADTSVKNLINTVTYGGIDFADKVAAGTSGVSFDLESARQMCKGSTAGASGGPQTTDVTNYDKTITFKWSANTCPLKRVAKFVSGAWVSVPASDSNCTYITQVFCASEVLP